MDFGPFSSTTAHAQRVRSSFRFAYKMRVPSGDQKKAAKSYLISVRIERDATSNSWISSNKGASTKDVVAVAKSGWTGDHAGAKARYEGNRLGLAALA